MTTNSKPSTSSEKNPLLFFRNRRPKRNFPRKWQEVGNFDKQIKSADFFLEKDIEDYIKQKAQEGTTDESADAREKVLREKFKTLFDSIHFLARDGMSQVREYAYLEKYLEFSQEAKWQQNEFYSFQWTFIMGAFATTALSIISVAIPEPPVKLFFGLATAFVGLFTGTRTIEYQKSQPQFEWYLNRRRAETLRSHFFLFMAQIQPYGGSADVRKDSICKLIDLVEAMGTSSQDVQTQLFNPKVDGIPTIELSEDEIEFLGAWYASHRLREQIKWYEARKTEFKHNIYFVLRASAWFVSLAGFLTTLTSFLTGAVWLSVLAGVIATILPAAAAMLVAFQQIYGWERQSTLYNDTITKLKQARQIFESRSTTDNPTTRLIKGITECEAIFAAESNQWGQGVLDQNIPGTGAISKAEFASMLDSVNASDPIKEKIRAILETPR